MKEIHKKLEEGLFIVSDGSAIQKKGSAAFIIANKKEIIIQSDLPVDRKYIESYRAEILGIIGRICLMKILSEQNGRTINIYCDNKSVLYELD